MPRLRANGVELYYEVIGGDLAQLLQALIRSSSAGESSRDRDDREEPDKHIRSALRRSPITNVIDVHRILAQMNVAGGVTAASGPMQTRQERALREDRKPPLPPRAGCRVPSNPCVPGRACGRLAWLTRV